MHTIVVEGTKGAGKTTGIKAACEALEAAGLKVAVHAPFADGNERYADMGGIFLCWQQLDTAREAMAWLKDSVLDAQERAWSNHTDVLIFDRHWITVACSIEDSVLPAHEANRIMKGWLDHRPQTIFLYCDPELTMERRKGQLDRRSGLDDPALVVRDYRRRVHLAQHYPDVQMLKAPDAGSRDVVQAVSEFIQMPLLPDVRYGR